MVKFLKNNWQFIVSELLILVIFAFFYGQFGDVMVDSFREIYIPKLMLNGDVLYKDIFCIYPPFAYLFNKWLFFIFGVNLKVLYFAALVCTLLIFYFVYRLSRKFFDKNLTFSILLFLIAVFPLSPNVFNSFFPYSYGMLYGLLFVLISVFCALNKMFALSYLFYSLAICSKYEFVFLLPLLIYWSRGKQWKQALAAFLSPILLMFVCLRGVGIANYLATFDILNTMSKTKTLYWFYSVSGLTFRPELIPIYLVNFLKFVFPINWSRYQEILIWAFPFVSIMSLYRAAKHSLYRREVFFVLAALLISIKVYFSSALQSYGVFFIPFALISIGIVIPRKIRKYYCFLLIVWAIIIGSFNIQSLLNKNYEIKTPVGMIKTTNYYGKSLDELVCFLQTLDKNSKVFVYPEALSANVLSDRLGDGKFYSLIPLYVETFGEDIIVKRLSIKRPEYIVISNYDTSPYYYSIFGKDYSTKVFEWIKSNYKLTKTISGGVQFDVYSREDL